MSWYPPPLRPLHPSHPSMQPLPPSTVSPAPSVRSHSRQSSLDGDVAPIDSRSERGSEPAREQSPLTRTASSAPPPMLSDSSDSTDERHSSVAVRSNASRSPSRKTGAPMMPVHRRTRSASTIESATPTPRTLKSSFMALESRAIDRIEASASSASDGDAGQPTRTRLQRQFSDRVPSSRTTSRTRRGPNLALDTARRSAATTPLAVQKDRSEMFASDLTGMRSGNTARGRKRPSIEMRNVGPESPTAGEEFAELFRDRVVGLLSAYAEAVRERHCERD